MSELPIDRLLAARAYQLRVDSLRATTAAGSGHATSALSAADLIAALFFETMRPEDRFVLSKGHAAPVLYAAYKQLGLISDEELLTLRQFDSALEGHPTPRSRPSELAECSRFTSFVSVATGSLGQGLANGLGMALAQRLQNNNARTFVMLGDSECSEGSVWEAALLAAHYEATSLTAIVDCNRLGQANATMWEHDTEKIANLWRACGWEAVIIDGHNIDEICTALANAGTKKKPYVIIARTIKGQGLPANIADHLGFHGKAFSKEELPGLLSHLEKMYSEAARDTRELENSSGPATLRQAQGDRNKPRSSQITKPVHPDPSLDFQASPRLRRTLAGLKAPIPFALSLSNGSPEPVSGVEGSLERIKTPATLATRHAIGAALEQVCAQDRSCIVLDAEVKNSTGTELIAEKDPAQFFETYIAEQSLIGIATGLASCGYTTFSSTFAAFLTRAHDQLRMAAISRLPLRVIGSHVGVSIGADGPSQMGLEDIALFRGLYESAVLYPCDAVSATRCIELAHGYTEGICYVRSTRNETPVIYDEKQEFTLGGHMLLREHDTDSCLIVTAGITVFEALKACDLLEKSGISVRVVDCYSIKPLPTEFLRASIEQCGGNLITVEDHGPVGGLGEAIAAATGDVVKRHTLLAVHILPRSGTSEQLMNFEQIDAAAIVAAVETLVR